MRVDTCDYSVHPRAIGRRVEVRMDLDEVVVTCAGDVVARHQRSLGQAPHHHRPRPRRSPARSPRAFAAALADDDEVEVRDLAVYDRATGVA